MQGILPDMEEAARQDPKNLTMRRLLARAYVVTGRREKGVETLNKVLADLPVASKAADEVRMELRGMMEE